MNLICKLYQFVFVLDHDSCSDSEKSFQKIKINDSNSITSQSSLASKMKENVVIHNSNSILKKSSTFNLKEERRSFHEHHELIEHEEKNALPSIIKNK